MVRDRIKTFARHAVGTSGRSGQKLPPFKIIILDEADSITKDAQAALRRTMETYSSVTRFCLICNYVSRIIDPLASRCAKFRFLPLSDKTMKERLQFVAKKEDLELTDEVVGAVLTASKGDLRKAITFLQSLSQLYKGQKLTPEAVFAVAGAPLPGALDPLWVAIDQHQFEDMQKALGGLHREGYSGLAIVHQLQKSMISKKMTDVQRGMISLQLAKTDKALTDGADEELQLLNCCAQVMNFMHTKMTTEAMILAQLA